MTTTITVTLTARGGCAGPRTVGHDLVDLTTPGAP